MAMAYIKVFFDWTEITALLSAEEKGRLIDALVCYGRDGSTEALLTGNERFVFAALTKRLDADKRRYERACASRARAGLRKKEDQEDYEDYEDQEDYEDYEDYEDDKPSVSRERNEHWRTSIMARKAEAQRLVDACIFEKLPCRGLKDLFDQILQAMENGLSPGKILDCCRRSEAHTLGLELYIAMKDRGLKPE